MPDALIPVEMMWFVDPPTCARCGNLIKGHSFVPREYAGNPNDESEAADALCHAHAWDLRCARAAGADLGRWFITHHGRRRRGRRQRLAPAV